MSNTIRYDTTGLFIGPTGEPRDLSSDDITQLSKIQSADFSIQVANNEDGRLGTFCLNSEHSKNPTVGLNVRYLLSDGRNENALGLVTNGLDGAFHKLNNDERDYFIVAELEDSKKNIAIGNGRLTSYSIQGSINSLISVEANISALNIGIQEASSINSIPRIDFDLETLPFTYSLPPLESKFYEREDGMVSSPSVVTTNNINLEFSNGIIFGSAGNEEDFHIQDFSLSIDLSRHDSYRLGDSIPFNRGLIYPIRANFSITALIPEYAVDSFLNRMSGRLDNATLTFSTNDCEIIDDLWEEKSKPVLIYSLKGLKLDSHNDEGAILGRRRVSLNWRMTIGNPKDLRENIFIESFFGELDYQASSSGNSSGTFFSHYTDFKRYYKETTEPDFSISFADDVHLSPNGSVTSDSLVTSSMDLSGFTGRFGLDDGIYMQSKILNIFGYDPVRSANSSYSSAPQWMGFQLSLGVQKEILFYVKSLGFSEEVIELTLGGLPESVVGVLEDETITLDKDKPFFISRILLTVNSASGLSLNNEIYLDVRSSTRHKIHFLNFSVLSN